MVEKQVTVTSPSGLHARPAALFVQAASRYRGTVIRVAKDGRTIDAKSILSIMSLGARQGTELTIRAEGEQEAEAVEVLESLLKNGFGED